ncbi:conserved phage C-terminal domain-containing protein [Trabulsiella odontotermitis]|uniref:GntR family transcriptional regulator n=1 Tax=Trabulsiella odontotermitis TaxID=379893 RepID=A0A0L0GGV7_9ENTR|nr:conserved phage C-terminal domain-containing protein [Trabulsiella odontotermitis]KNC88280.1 GntR family transcriptional regulator [Trabulsiella odontotermitis]
MSVKISSWVWDGCAASGVKGTKLLIMARLADFSNDDGVSWCGIDTIARQIGAGRSTVITAIGELERDGWLTRKERRNGARNATNIYTLNVAKLRESAEAADRHSPDSERSKSEPSESERSKSERSENAEKGDFHSPESGPDPSVNSKHDPSDIKTPCRVPPEPDPEVVITDQAIEVLSHLNLISGSRYQKSRSSLENIRARLREGNSVDDLKLVIDLKHEHWHDNDEQYQYMRPETLFGPKKFESYLQSALRWDKKGRPLREYWGRKRDIMTFGPVDTTIPEGFRG